MRKTILIIDDSPSVRQIVADALVDADFQVLEAKNGKDALTKLDGKQVHLIICDMGAPNTDGVAFVREVKKLAHCRSTPVIMLTSASDESGELKKEIEDAKAWLVRPSRKAQMVKMISRLIVPDKDE